MCTYLYLASQDGLGQQTHTQHTHNTHTHTRAHTHTHTTQHTSTHTVSHTHTCRDELPDRVPHSLCRKGRRMSSLSPGSRLHEGTWPLTIDPRTPPVAGSMIAPEGTQGPGQVEPLWLWSSPTLPPQKPAGLAKGDPPCPGVRDGLSDEDERSADATYLKACRNVMRSEHSRRVSTATATSTKQCGE